MTYQHVDLKVCEGCGALWLRNASAPAASVYCRRCASRLAEFPQPRQLRPFSPRKPRAARVPFGRAAVPPAPVRLTPVLTLTARTASAGGAR